MNYYETLYIIHPALDGGRIKEMVLSVDKILKKTGGASSFLDIWGKKKLAYEMDRRLYKVESNLFDVKLTGAREDAFRNPNKLYGRLAALGSDLTRFGADFKPTNQQVEVYQVLSERLQQEKVNFNLIMDDNFWDSEKK